MNANSCILTYYAKLYCIWLSLNDLIITVGQGRRILGIKKTISLVLLHQLKYIFFKLHFDLLYYYVQVFPCHANLCFYYTEYHRELVLLSQQVVSLLKNLYIKYNILYIYNKYFYLDVYNKYIKFVICI